MLSRAPLVATKRLRTCFSTREGSVLILLQDFGEALAAAELGLSGFVELVGAELRESSEVAILRHVQTQRTSDLAHGLDLRVAADAADGNTDVDSGTNAGVEKVGFQINLAVGDGDHVGGNVGGNVSSLRFDYR